MTIRHYAYAAGIATSLVLFAACGDDVTEVTNVSENASLARSRSSRNFRSARRILKGPSFM